MFFELRVKVIWVDLLSLIFILHKLYQFFKLVRSSWRLFMAESKLGLDEVIAVSSAKVDQIDQLYI
jgi:hypothetical protein